MTSLSLHLAPHAPWLALLLLSVALLALARWAYRFAAPPLPVVARRALPWLRAVALLVLAWLLAQPVLERAAGGGVRLVVLLDRSRSMDLPASPGGPTRAEAARRVVDELTRAWRTRAGVDVLPFAATLGDPDSSGGREATALGDALDALGRTPAGQRANGVVVVSDGVVDAGGDPVGAARALGIPVHAVVVGDAGGRDRAVAGIDAPVSARVGLVTPVRVRVTSTEARGTPFGVRLLGEGRELGRATVVSPGPGQEVTADFRVSPTHPGLAVWTAIADSLPGEMSTVNDARQVAVEVSPGRLGVVIVSGGLNWDLAFLRRSLAGDSSLSVTTWVRDRGGFASVEHGAKGPFGPDLLRGAAVVVLDALAPAELGPGFDAALAGFVRGGGGLLAFGGPAPGVERLRAGRLGSELAPALDPRQLVRPAAPQPTPEGRELLAWDDDPARGDQAWRAAAPLADAQPLSPGGGDRVLLASQGGGPPLLLARRIGRGQALLVNGTGLWRWTLSPSDELAAERGRRLWRRLVQWLAEPVQGEALRVRPERWLAAGGETVRLFATLQDASYQPVAGATVEGEITGGGAAPRHVTFEPQAAGSYVAVLDGLPAGRWRVDARATGGARPLGRAGAEFAVDRWSLEAARTLPDSATLAAVAAASGGSLSPAAHAGAWARGLSTRALVRVRTESLRLWESPWLFGVVVGLLSLEWAWRRRRGLP